MSIECLNKALKIKGLSPTKKLILVLLANYADEKGSCYPSLKHIAEIIGLKTTKTIRTAIQEFESLGYLKIEYRKLENGGNTSNKYHLKLDTVFNNPKVIEDTTLLSSVTPNTKDNTKNIYTKDFEDFWNKYPRKISKKSAFNSYKKALKQEKPEYINLCALRFAESCKAKNIEEQYIPHASTWLNQERWTDVIITKIKTLNNLAG